MTGVELTALVTLVQKGLIPMLTGLKLMYKLFSGREWTQKEKQLIIIKNQQLTDKLQNL